MTDSSSASDEQDNRTPGRRPLLPGFAEPRDGLRSLAALGKDGESV